MPYPPALSTSTSAITTAASCVALIIVRTLYTRSRPKGPPPSGLAALPEGASQLRDGGDGGDARRAGAGRVVTRASAEGAHVGQRLRIAPAGRRVRSELSLPYRIEPRRTGPADRRSGRGFCTKGAETRLV